MSVCASICYDSSSICVVIQARRQIGLTTLFMSERFDHERIVKMVEDSKTTSQLPQCLFCGFAQFGPPVFARWTDQWSVYFLLDFAPWTKFICNI